jgi:ABC-type amino acid transport substrate-binding protein
MADDTKKPQMRICVEGAYPPFSYISPEGEIVGFDIDIALTLCDELGYECTLISTGWEAMVPSLNSMRCDAIIASMSLTKEREKIMSFTEPYLITPSSFVGLKKASWIDTPEGLEDVIIGVQKGTVAHAYLEERYPLSRLKLYRTQLNAEDDLIAGRVDLIFTDLIQAKASFLKSPKGKSFEIIGREHYDDELLGRGSAIAIRKGELELVEKFNKALSTIHQNGIYQKINEKYFDFDIYVEN